MRVAPETMMNDGEHAELMKLVRTGLPCMRFGCARIVLLAADGMLNKDIACQLGVGRAQVSHWRERYAQSRLAGIERATCRGAKVDVA